MSPLRRCFKDGLYCTDRCTAVVIEECEPHDPPMSQPTPRPEPEEVARE